MKRHFQQGIVAAGLAAFCWLSQAFETQGTIARYTGEKLLPKLSAYTIFQGSPAKLAPAANFHLYELSAPLFSDYALKQRLIRLPKDSVLAWTGDGLPRFPDGTMLVKTFYYADPETAAKRRIVETRLLLLSKGKWIAGTYVWNAAQTDADLLQSPRDVPVRYRNENNAVEALAYHLPGPKECVTCHGFRDAIQPIGPELRNLNRKVIRNEKAVNQLVYLQEMGLLQVRSGAETGELAAYSDQQVDLEKRARAYLSINCAHCHRVTGAAARTNLLLHTTIPLDKTGILEKRERILQQMETGRMPKLGTTVVHHAGMELIRAYLQTLD
jgi:uncharacterized repeat protein (TIGR03806 family)